MYGVSNYSKFTYYSYLFFIIIVFTSVSTTIHFYYENNRNLNLYNNLTKEYNILQNNFENLKLFTDNERKISESYIQSLKKQKKKSTETIKKQEEIKKIPRCKELFDITIPIECMGGLLSE